MATRLTEDLVKGRSGQFDLESVQWLDCAHMNVAVVEVIDKCTSLQDLKLGDNNIKTLSCIAGLPRLTSLDVSHNKLSTLDGLEGLTALKSLRLQGNKIKDIAEVSKLEGMTALKSLHLADLGGTNANPVCSHPSYTAVMLRTLPSLDMLDGEHMVLRETAQKVMMESVSVDEKEVERELPPSKPWTDDVDLSVPVSATERDPEVDKAAKAFHVSAADVVSLEEEADAALKAIGSAAAR